MSALDRMRPWLVFLAGGAALGLLLHLLAPSREVLVVDGYRVGQTIKWEEESLGRPLTDAERDAMTVRIVDEEILLAEASHQGRHRRGYVHARLLKKMRFLFTEELEVPSDAELRAVYDADPARFRRPRSLAFEQAFFAKGSTSAPADLDAFLAQLRDGADWRTVGDTPALGRDVGLRSEAELRARLGGDTVGRLLAVPIDVWAGPVESEDGVRYVRVRVRSDPGTVPFDEALPQLRGAWVLARQREVIARRTAETVGLYEIHIVGEQ